MPANGVELRAKTVVAGAPFDRHGSVTIHFQGDSIIVANTCGRYNNGSGTVSFKTPYVNVLASDGRTTVTSFFAPTPDSHEGIAFDFAPEVFSKAVSENLEELLRGLRALRENGSITPEQCGDANAMLGCIQRKHFPSKHKKIFDNQLPLFEINFMTREG